MGTSAAASHANVIGKDSSTKCFVCEATHHASDCPLVAKRTPSLAEQMGDMLLQCY